jgi:thiamine biosynthesis lipoprotein
MMISAEPMRKNPLGIILSLGVALLAPACRRTDPSGSDLIEFHGSTMGTTYTVKAVLPPPLTRERVQGRIDENLKRVNKLMSTYDPESELSRFNRARGQVWFAIAPETYRVFKTAMEIGRLSGGALDVTVGRLVNLWGFGPENRPGTPPSSEALAEAMELTGWHLLKLRDEPPAVWKEKDGVYCDLSAVAKGYGVDLLAETLAESGVAAYMIEVGGEVRAAGKRPDGLFWNIGVAIPDGSQKVQRILRLGDMAMATSGDYYNSYEMDGRRYSHTIDPHQGRPIVNNVASVTVLHPSCLEADAWATALTVLGPEEGMALGEERKLPVLFIVRETNGFVERRNQAMKAYIME